MLNYIIKKYSANSQNAPATAQGNYEGEVVYSTAPETIKFDYKPFTKDDYRPVQIVDEDNALGSRVTGSGGDINEVFDSLSSGSGR